MEGRDGDSVLSQLIYKYMPGSIEKGTYKVLTLLDALTASGSSEEIVIAGAKRITLFFTRAAHAAGSSAFDVDVSLDGTTYVDFNKLITNSVNAISEGKVRVASVSLASNTTVAVAMDLEDDSFYTMKVNVVETTDGTHSCKGLIEF
jgi:hypothetical protein